MAESEKKIPADTEKSAEDGILVTEKSMEILVAKFIPTSQYFERSFLMLQNQVVDLRDGQKDLKRDMERRFEQVDVRFVDLKQDMDKRFEQVDKRFEQVDKRFEQVDKRFDSIESKLDTLIDKVDTKIDAGLRENRSIAIRLFTFAMLFSAVSMAGVLGKIAGIF